READLRDDLGRYGFSGDAALRRIGPMSGGEKARLVLAGIVRRRPHLLVLDEPTNHLDAATRDALTEALAEFEGALLLVSHDRYLLRATVDSFLLINDGRAGEFEGDLDDYLRWLQRGEGSEAERSHAGQNANVVRQDRRQDRRAAAERRAQLAEKLRPIDKELSSIEARLASIEAVRVDLEGQLSNPAIYENGARVADLNRDLSTQVREKELLESRWLELGERRESIEREFEARA
ncbi:MAG: ATP-binding cassette domain-containing protein, partial [Quisquiliibacterium sp.]